MKVRHTAAILATMVLLSGCRKESGLSAAPGVGSAVTASPSASTPAATALASAITGVDVDNPPPFVPPKLTPEEMAEDLWTCTNDWWEGQRSLKPFCQWALTAWTGDDLDASAKKYKADCDKGDGLACVLSVGGYYLVKSPLRSKLFELAQDEDAKLVIKACELGTPVACIRLASLLGCIDDQYGDAYGCKPRVVGFLQRKGISGVRAMLEPLCAKGDGASCRSIGGLLRRDASKLTLEERKMQALGYDERACELGDSWGCDSGAQTIKILADAKLAQKGQAMAARSTASYEKNCLRLGECGHAARVYLAGEEVPADAAKARGYFARACAYGLERSGYCIDLADLQAEGKGGPANVEAARKVYEKECRVMTDGGALKSYQYREMARGCRGLAHLYQEGLGVPKDEKRAYEILDRACVVPEHPPEELGLLCLDLARAEIDGRGAPVNLEQAIRRLEDPQRNYPGLKAEYKREMDRAAALRKPAAGK